MAEVNGPILEDTSADHQSAMEQSVTAVSSDAIMPPTSHADRGLSRRPRDARLLHMILANYGVTAYQERVPLQLMDFAYRYTSSTLQDALHFSSEGYGVLGPGTGSGRSTAHSDLSSVTLSALRLSIASRTHYQFSPTLPKEFFNDIAQEKNRVALPPLSREWGMRLPPEQYCLTGVGWDLTEELETNADEDMTDFENSKVVSAIAKEESVEEDPQNSEGGRMEDLFGTQSVNDIDDDMEG